MTYAIVWSHAALRTFFSLAPHTAMIVDRAVLRFAQAGEGDLRHEAPYHHLRAGKYDLLLAVVPAERRLTVLPISTPTALPRAERLDPGRRS